MSLDVPTALLERAQHGEVDDADFVDCVRLSLPYAWQVVSGVVADLELAGEAVEFADHEIPHPAKPSAGSCCGRWPPTPSAAVWNTTSG